jgi:phosphoglycerate dehydrogenase-like enzyme
LQPDFVRQIASVSPRVRAVEAYVPAVESPDPNKEGDWRKIADDALDAALSEAEVFFTFRFDAAWAAKAPNLKWIQLASAGSDFIMREGLLDKHPDVTLTTASGVHEVPISEHILGMILYFSRGFHNAVRSQPLHKWERYRGDEALDRTVLLIGYGQIARRAATLCKAIGLRVLCVRASLLEQQPGFEGVERFYPLEDLDSVLAESDYVVVAAPRTPRSEGMIGAAQFAVMKPGAVLINISRGALVDEEALVEALQAGRIAGAGLDVFAQEPLPESSPLWDLPNVLVTPHVSGSSPHYNERVTALFCANLLRYLNGEDLKNVVDRERGY